MPKSVSEVGNFAARPTDKHIFFVFELLFVPPHMKFCMDTGKLNTFPLKYLIFSMY